VSHLSPAARNGQENFWRFLYKCRLLLQCKHQISVACCLRRQRSKLPASDSKSRQSRVRVLFHASQAECDLAKIGCGHLVTPTCHEYLTTIGWHLSSSTRHYSFGFAQGRRARQMTTLGRVSFAAYGARISKMPPKPRASAPGLDWFALSGAGATVPLIVVDDLKIIP